MRSFSNQNLDRLKKWWVPFSISVKQRCYLETWSRENRKTFIPEQRLAGWGIVPTFIFRIILTQWPQLNNKSKLMSPINWLPKLIKSHNPCLLGRYKLLLCPWGKEEKFNLILGSVLGGGDMKLLKLLNCSVLTSHSYGYLTFVMWSMKTFNTKHVCIYLYTAIWPVTTVCIEVTNSVKI